MNGTTIITTVSVCVIPPISMQELAVVTENVDQMDTTGGSILENLPIAKPLVIKFKYFQQLKNGLKAISCTLSTLEEILQYIPYAAILLLSSNQKSNRFLAIM